MVEGQEGVTWEQWRALARAAEDAGLEGLFRSDHYLPILRGVRTGSLDAWATLAALAAVTSRIRLGTMVSPVTFRPASVLAKSAVTVDHVSGGRLVLGIGAGWQRNEHTAYGLEFSDVKGRLDRLEEACAIVTSLLNEDRTTYDGTYYQVVNAPLAPKPPRGHLPLLVGGGGERRTMRIAAEYADEWNIWGTPELLAQKGEVLDRHCETLGRDPSSIRRSANALLFISEDESWLAQWRERDVGRPIILGTPAEVVDIVAAYADVGVDELIIPDFNLGDPAHRAESLDLFAEEVMAKLG